LAEGRWTRAVCPPRIAFTGVFLRLLWKITTLLCDFFYSCNGKTDFSTVTLEITLLVGAMFSLPQNIGHILANPLLPLASMRLSHLIETASSTFVFGMLVAWLLHREHKSVKDLFGLG